MKKGAEYAESPATLYVRSDRLKMVVCQRNCAIMRIMSSHYVCHTRIVTNSETLTGIRGTTFRIFDLTTKVPLAFLLFFKKKLFS